MRGMPFPSIYQRFLQTQTGSPTSPRSLFWISWTSCLPIIARATSVSEASPRLKCATTRPLRHDGDTVRHPG